MARQQQIIGHVEDEQRLHAVIGEALPRLGEGEIAEPLGVAEEGAVAAVGAAVRARAWLRRRSCGAFLCSGRGRLAGGSTGASAFSTNRHLRRTKRRAIGCAPKGETADAPCFPDRGRPRSGRRHARRRRARATISALLLDEHYRWLLRENPTDATALGVRDYDDRIRDISPEARERRAGEAQAFLARLERDSGRAARARRPGQRAHPAPLARRRRSRQTISASATCCSPLMTAGTRAFAGMARSLPFRTRADFESYLTRIAQYPRLNDQALAITANAVRGGYVLPCSVLGGHERSISGVIADGSGPVALLRALRRRAPRLDRRSGLGGAAGAGAADDHRRAQPGLSEASRFLPRPNICRIARARDSVSRPAGRRALLRLPGARSRPPPT